MGKRAMPWLPMYVDDYNHDTEDLTCEQDGAYWRLLRKCWIRGSLPDDDDKLAQICGVTKTRWMRHIAPAVRPFFMPAGPGKITQKRLEKERIKSQKISEERAESARKRWPPNPESPPPEPGHINGLGDANASANGYANGKGTHKQSLTHNTKEQGTSTNLGTEDLTTQDARAERRKLPLSKLRHNEGLMVGWDGITASQPQGPSARSRPQAGRDCYENVVFMLPTIEKVCAAAGFPDSWWGDWECIASWLNRGIKQATIIRAIETQMEMRRKGANAEKPISSLAYFNVSVERLHSFRSAA